MSNADKARYGYVDNPIGMDWGTCFERRRPCSVEWCTVRRRPRGPVVQCHTVIFHSGDFIAWGIGWVLPLQGPIFPVLPMSV